MTIAATQTFPGAAWDELPDVMLLDSWPPAEPLPGVDVLVEAVVAVGPAELDLLPDLRLVANYGVGYDRVDVAVRMGLCRRLTFGLEHGRTALGMGEKTKAPARGGGRVFCEGDG